MKQHITLKQGIEIFELDGRSRLLEFINERSSIKRETYEYIDEGVKISKSIPLLNIGEMIEFLGDDWNEQTSFEMNGIPIPPLTEDLCNWLWEAVKYKLKAK